MNQIQFPLVNYQSTIYSVVVFSTTQFVPRSFSCKNSHFLYLQLTALITDGCDKLAEYTSFTGRQHHLSNGNFHHLSFIGEHELSRSLVLIMELLESVTINSQQILQTDKSSAFTFCQTPIERIVTDASTKDLFPNILK